MAGWNTPARNAGINKRPCDQKTRWVFGHGWQGQHRSWRIARPTCTEAVCGRRSWMPSAGHSRRFCHVPLSTTSDIATSDRDPSACRPSRVRPANDGHNHCSSLRPDVSRSFDMTHARPPKSQHHDCSGTRTGNRPCRNNMLGVARDRRRRQAATRGTQALRQMVERQPRLAQQRQQRARKDRIRIAVAVGNAVEYRLAGAEQEDAFHRAHRSEVPNDTCKPHLRRQFIAFGTTR